MIKCALCSKFRQNTDSELFTARCSADCRARLCYGKSSVRLSVQEVGVCILLVII